MVVFIQGDSVYIVAEFWDEYGNAQDPDSHSIKIVDSTGELIVDSTEPLKKAPGAYYYYLDLEDDCVLGTWTVTWKGVMAGKDRILQDIFIVEKYALKES